MRLLYIDPVGVDAMDPGMYDALLAAKGIQTEIEMVALPQGRPHHVEYHSYEAQVIADIVRITWHEAPAFDAIIIGCFYDVGLREAREVSGRAPVVAPCHSSSAIAAMLSHRFSVLVGREKWVSKMRENLLLYGHGERLASFRTMGMGVRDFQVDHELTCERLLEAGRAAIEQDGAEALILGCTAEFGFYSHMQQELGVPVLDPVISALKTAEMMAEAAERFDWLPSRVGASEGPPVDEVARRGFFGDSAPIGTRLAELAQPQ